MKGFRILIVNVHWLGDVLLSTPAIRALRKKYPDSFIACLVPPRCGVLLENNPNLNEVILLEEKLTLASFGSFLKTLLEIRKKRFDMALFFHRSKTKAFLTYAAAIPERIGFSAPARDWLLTHAYPAPEKGLHRTDHFLKLLEYLDIPLDGRAPDFFPKKEAEGELDRLLGEAGVEKGARFAVVHAGGNWDLKRWPVSYFVAWIRSFLERFDWPVILCGTTPEAPLAKEIQGHFPDQRVISLCGRTSLDTLALLLKRAEFLLSNDSGPIHLAATQGTRILGLFGPTHPAETGPISGGAVFLLRKDVGCEVPCYFKTCNTRVCMEWLTPEEVFQKTVECLAP